MASRHPPETTGRQPPPTPPPPQRRPRSTRRERSPPRTADDAPDEPPGDAPASTSPAAQPDPTSDASCSSQLPSIECCCDDRLNSPSTPAVNTPRPCTTTTSWRPSEAPAIPTTTRSPRALSTPSR